MDLANIDLAAAADKGADLHLWHPVTDEPLYTEDGKPVTIRLLGRDSKEFRAAAADIAERLQGKKKTSLRAVEQQTVDLLSRVTVGWSGISWEGEPLKFSRENAKLLYAQRPWVREEVDEFIGDRAHFFGSGKAG